MGDFNAPGIPWKKIAVGNRDKIVCDALVDFALSFFAQAVNIRSCFSLVKHH